MNQCQICGRASSTDNKGVCEKCNKRMKWIILHIPEEVIFERVQQLIEDKVAYAYRKSKLALREEELLKDALSAFKYLT